MATKTYWRCTICNDLHYGADAPEKCPTCGAPREKHEQIDEEKFKEIMEVVK